MDKDVGEYLSVGRRRDDLYRCCRPFLILGSCCGLFPISGLFQKQANKLQFGKFNVPIVLSVVTILWSVINLGISLNFLFRTDKKNPSDIAWASNPLVFYIVGFCTFFYFLWHVKDLIGLFQMWNTTSISMYTEDTKLYRDTLLISGGIFISCVMENVVWHLKRFPVFDHAEVVIHRFNISADASPLEVFYYRGYAYWGKFVSYNKILAMLLFSINKFILYGGNLSDILIALFSRAFYFRFKSLVDIGTEKLKRHSNDPEFWSSLISEHEKLCELLKHFSDFLSPMVFLSYAAHCFNTCLTLHTTLTPSANSSFGGVLHALWSLLHHVMIVLVLTLFGARLNESAKGIVDVFQQCPENCYTQEVERTVRSTLSKKMIGFHGLNCFFITKPLILSFVSVVVTFEIVLLQATAPTKKPP